MPQVEHSYNPALFVLVALVEMIEGELDIFGESGSKDVLVGPELMPGLAHDGVDDIKAGNLVFRSALLDELFHALHNVFVELDGLDGSLGDGCHLGL